MGLCDTRDVFQSKSCANYPDTRIPGAEPESPYESFRSTDQASFAIPEPVSLSERPTKSKRGVTTRVEGKVR